MTDNNQTGFIQTDKIIDDDNNPSLGGYYQTATHRIKHDAYSANINV